MTGSNGDQIDHYFFLMCKHECERFSIYDTINGNQIDSKRSTLEIPKRSAIWNVPLAPPPLAACRCTGLQFSRSPSVLSDNQPVTSKTLTEHLNSIRQQSVLHVQSFQPALRACDDSDRLTVHVYINSILPPV